MVNEAEEALSSAADVFHTPGVLLRETAQRLGRAAFESDHPYLWLVRDMEARVTKDPSFATAFASEGERSGADLALARRIAQAPHVFGFYPFKKMGKNPWKDRLLIGRATNNDVVLRHSSVSKVHARAVLRDGAWLLSDANSTNGTWMDGLQIAGTALSAPLLSGTVLTFGSIRCTVLDSAEVFDALTS